MENKTVEYLFKDILEIKYGKNQAKVVNGNGKYPILGTGGIMGYADKYLYDKPSILIGRKGTINKPVFMDTPFWTIDTLFYTVLNEKKVNPKYLFYRFKIINFLQYNEATGVPSLKSDTLYRISVKIHENLDTQRHIATVLSTLDAKIELHQKLNAELEAMAKTLYDYWFVQFDFPDAEGKPYKSSGGSMTFSKELNRDVPTGWEIGVLSDVANITMGQSPPGESYNEIQEGIIFFQGCTDFGSRFPSIRQYTTAPSRIAQKGDILLSVRAPVGTMNIANHKCCIGRGLAAINGKNNTTPYLSGVLNNFKIIFDRRNVNGTTFGSITKEDLFSLQVVIPYDDVLLKYQSILNPIFEKQNQIEQETQELQRLRDWLLPMLMNGQVEVGKFGKLPTPLRCR